MPDRPRVYSIAFELTTQCNLRCAHCYNACRGPADSSEHTRTQHLLARIERVLDQVDLHHATLTGGEPLLSSALFDVLGVLRSNGIPCQIISNGVLLDGDMARRLAAAGARGIQVSLHGPTAADHEAYTGVPGSYARTRRAVQAAHDAGLPLTGCIVITRRNAHQVGDTLALWRSLNVERVALSRFSPAGLAREHVAQLLPSLPEAIDAFDQALPFAKDGMALFCTMPIPPCAMETSQYAPIRFGSCAVGTAKQELALGPTGALRNCALHDRPIGGVPDILAPDIDLKSLIAHPDVTRYRDQPPAFCRGCLYARSCGGGCGAASMTVLAGDRSLPDPFLWQHLDDEFAAQLQRERQSAPIASSRRVRR